MRVVVAVLLAVGLTACTAVVSGAPQRSTHAATLLGDVRTIDPCSLADESAFTEYGTVGGGSATGFDTCQFDIGRSSGSIDALVVTGQLIQLRPETMEIYQDVRNLSGGMWVRTYDSAKDPDYDGEGSCEELIGFTDGIGLRTNAVALDRSARSMLCELTETATQEALRVIKAGGVRHREYAKRSLGRLDACALVPGNPLADTALYAGAEREPRPAGHECYWHVGEVPAGSVGRVVLLSFAMGSPVSDGEKKTIGGRRSVVTKSSGREVSSCEVQTEHVAYQAEDSGVESASVYATGPGDKVDEVCAGALAVAEVVWPKLPAS